MTLQVSESIFGRLCDTYEEQARRAQKEVLVSVHALRLPVTAREAEEERDLEGVLCRLHHLRHSQTPCSFQ